MLVCICVCKSIDLRAAALVWCTPLSAPLPHSLCALSIFMCTFTFKTEGIESHHPLPLSTMMMTNAIRACLMNTIHGAREQENGNENNKRTCTTRPHNKNPNGSSTMCVMFIFSAHYTMSWAASLSGCVCVLAFIYIVLLHFICFSNHITWTKWC